MLLKLQRAQKTKAFEKGVWGGGEAATSKTLDSLGAMPLLLRDMQASGLKLSI